MTSLRPRQRGSSRQHQACALAAVVFLATLPAAAFVRTTTGTPSNTCLYWTPRNHDWWLYQNPQAPGSIAGLVWSDVQAAVERSVQTWQSSGCSDVNFTFQGGTPNFKVGFDPNSSTNQNLVIFREEACPGLVPDSDACLTNDSCGDNYNCWGHTNAIIALTTVTFDNNTGELADADIEFNATGVTSGTPFYRFTDVDGPVCASILDAAGNDCVATDVQNTATHETGHFLGLAHTPDSAATMYASAPAGQTSKRVLSDDDINGLCTMYPRGGETNWCVPPAAPVHSCAVSGPGDLGGLLTAGLMLRRRRLRRQKLAVQLSR